MFAICSSTIKKCIPRSCGSWRGFEANAWVTSELFINLSRMQRCAVPWFENSLRCIQQQIILFRFSLAQDISLASINLVSRVVKEMCEKSRSCKAIKPGPERKLRIDENRGGERLHWNVFCLLVSIKRALFREPATLFTSANWIQVERKLGIIPDWLKLILWFGLLVKAIAWIKTR